MSTVTLSNYYLKHYIMYSNIHYVKITSLEQEKKIHKNCYNKV